MKPLSERAKEAEERIAPIMTELNVLLGAKPTITEEGKLGALVQWVDTYKEPAEAIVSQSEIEK